jgi:hypothetical protein
MKKLLKKFAWIGLLAGTIGGAAGIAERVADACQVAVVRVTGCTCRNFQPDGWDFCSPGNAVQGCTVHGNGCGGGGGGQPL